MFSDSFLVFLDFVCLLHFSPPCSLQPIYDTYMLQTLELLFLFAKWLLSDSDTTLSIGEHRFPDGNIKKHIYGFIYVQLCSD